MSTPKYTVLTTPSLTFWVYDRDQVIIVNEIHQRKWVVNGFDALLWNCLMFASEYEQLLATLSTLVGIPADEIKQKIDAIILSWRESGLLVEKGCTYGESDY